jgi:hypothetical protein
MKFNKKSIAAVVAALLALLGTIKTVLDALPESSAPVPASSAADAGVAK